MKRNLTLSLICVLIILSSTRVAYAQQKESYGIKGGINSSSFTNTDGRSDSRTSIHLGVFANLRLWDTGAFQPELLYSGQGAKYTKVDYILLPMVLKAYMQRGFNFQFGGQLGHLITNSESFTKIDASLLLGIGIESKSGSVISCRYAAGLTNLDNSGDGSILRNRVIQLSVGFKL